MVTVRPVLVAAAGAALLLAGCDQPKPRTPPPAAETPAAAAPPVATDPGPVPAPPAWANGMMGRKYSDAFASPQAKCEGNTDGVLKRYGGTSPGTQIEGWGWDPAAKAAVARVILVDADSAIVGAGDTGRARPDVTAARPDITSPTTGWTAVTLKIAGPVTAWGIVGEGVLCPLGRLDF